MTELEKTPVRRAPRRERGGWASGFLGAVVEAWDELRIHKTRVLLSLIGVGVAVCALTSVVGIGAIAQQAQIEQLERGSGRPATLVLSPPYNPETGQQGDPAIMAEAAATVVERYAIGYAGSTQWMQLSAQFRDGVSLVDAQAVDVDYGVMHRVQVGQGRWFVDRDELRLAPAIVVSDQFWQRLGSPDLRTHPTIQLLGEDPVTAVVVGVLPVQPFDLSLRAYILNSAYASLATPEQIAQAWPQYEFWVPPDMATELTDLIRRDVAAACGEGWQVDVNRQDYLAWEGGEDPTASIRMVLAGIAVLILILGALGLVNISLVTVRQRIREIGIRRSFGATAPRVFFAVMMESVVATVVAGVAGVVVAVAIVQNPVVRDFVAFGLTDVPPFPVEAALLGLGAATAVGALAGLLPALVAVRVKVIDAIRY
ncbi:ABC transporter permease [Salinibacterium soli]|uniref:ABC transporter permease n=1 Tax=Antiquaquibacter soli TaxID=3064523 RepID=A0ABT9BQN8_9MICO|nr:ABC transporter permease [Protaetiibacter sp. WY-16]MDO7881710.1 ABC transporter permease [Protaetiibacter sp. WY-16]